MTQSSVKKTNLSQNSSKNLHSRNGLIVPKNSQKTSENMREISIKLMAIMKAKKECSIV